MSKLNDMWMLMDVYLTRHRYVLSTAKVKNTQTSDGLVQANGVIAVTGLFTKGVI